MNQDTAHTKRSYTLSTVEATAGDRAIGAEPVMSWLRSASRRVWLALSAIWAAVIGPKINDEGNGSTATPGSSSPPTSSHKAHHE